MSISEALLLDVAGAPPPATVVAAPRAAAVSALVSPAVVAREALIVALLVAGLTALLAPRDLGFGVAPHPGWAAVILVSARYGSRGFGLALFAVWGTLTLTALAMGVSTRPLAVGRRQLRPRSDRSGAQHSRCLDLVRARAPHR